MAALALALLALPSVQAAGLGGYGVQSWLGQPLRMVVQITTRADEVVDIGCFKLNPYTVANDGLPQLTDAQLTLDKRGNQQRLIISSARPILDPIVRVSIDIGCDTTLRRELTLLLDPQPLIETQAEAAAPAVPAGTPIAPAARPATSAAADVSAGAASSGSAASGAGNGSTGAAAGTPQAGGAAAATPATPPQAPRQGSAASASASKAPAPPRPPRTLKAADGQARAQPRPRPPKTAAQQPRDRLTISTSGPPLESYAGAPITPRLMLSTTLTDRRGQPPLPESVLSILRQKQARLKAAPVEEDIPSVEAELVVLQKRTAEMRSQLDAVMAQTASLRGSEGSAGGGSAPARQPAAGETPQAATPVSSMPDAPLADLWNWRDPRFVIAILLGLVVLLLIVAAASWLRRERGSRRAARWNQTPYVPATAPPPPPAPQAFGVTRDAGKDTTPAERPSMPESYTFSQYSAGEAARELGVSDLAQATEKASVFVTLGRPEQAIDVLRDHIDHEPKPSPMAWLMLLDLYRQNDRRSDFLDVSKRFHREFNAEIPPWDQTSPLHDAGLAAFPHLIHRIRDDWPKAGARAFIEELLYDNRGGSRIGFSLPAFRDLLLLHSIIDDYLAALDTPERIDPRTGALIPPPSPPVPPPGLAEVWAAPTAKPPEFPPQAPLHLDMGLLSDSQERSALEIGYPIIAEAIMTRWAKPGVAEYLDKLIRSTDDSRSLSLSNAAMAELIMLHDLALELAQPQSA